MADHPRVASQPPMAVVASSSASVPPIPTPNNHPWSISRILGPPEHHSSTSSAEPPTKRRRTVPCADGCTWCRKKKIKCSGKPQDAGPCTNCSRDGLACSFVAGPDRVARVTPSQDVTEAGTPRKRAQRACRECHAHKTKCSGSLPVCARCTNLGIQCIYEPSKRKFSSAPGSAASQPTKKNHHGLSPATNIQTTTTTTTNFEAKQLVSPSISSLSPGPSASTRRASLANHLFAEDLLSQKDSLTRHFQIWFKLFGRLPLLSILHPQSTFTNIEENRLDPTLGRIVCAITARIMCPGSRTLPEFAEKCSEQVDLHIFQNISSSLRGDGRRNLIILLIAVCHHWLEFQMGKVWMYMALAGRLITALQLNCVGAGDTPVQQEITRRLVWAIWNIDHFLAGGFEEHLVLRDEYMRIKMPIMDIDFPGEDNEDSATTSPNPLHPSTNNTQSFPLSVYHINLNRVRHRILSFTKQLPIPPTPEKRGATLEASAVIGHINGLQKILCSFNTSLPSQLKVSDVSIEKWVNLPESGSFIMLWTNFWGLYIELYLFSIPGLREEAHPELTRKLPANFVIKSQKQAVAYAISLSQFWRSVQDIVAKRRVVDGTERLYTVDQTLIINIIRSTKVLLAAREHKSLINGVQEDSTAPLIPQGSLTDEFLEGLIKSNMGLFEQFEHYYPVTIERLTHDLRTAVNNFKKDSPFKYNSESHLFVHPQSGVCHCFLPRTDQSYLNPSPHESRSPEDIRLPGPHRMLENATSEPHNNDDRDMQRNLSAAEQFMRRRKEQNQSDHTSASTATTASEARVGYMPIIPEWLNHARAQEIPPGVPALPRSNFPLDPDLPTSTLPISQLDPSPGPPIARPGQLYFMDHAHTQYATAIPSTVGNFNTIPVLHNTSMNNTYGSTSMQYARARGGGRKIRVSFQPDYDHYERAAGKRLPFPDISNLLRNESMPLT